jgi:hypothetical protein
MRVSGLGWLLKISRTKTSSSLKKFYLAVTLSKVFGMSIFRSVDTAVGNAALHHPVL